MKKQIKNPTIETKGKNKWELIIVPKKPKDLKNN